MLFVFVSSFHFFTDVIKPIGIFIALQVSSLIVAAEANNLNIAEELD